MATAMSRNYAAMAAEGRSRTRYIFSDPVFDDVLTRKQPLRAERRPAGPFPWRRWTDEFRDRWSSTSDEALRLTLAGDALDGAPEICRRILGLAVSEHLEVAVSPFAEWSPEPPFAPFSLEQREGPHWILTRAVRDGEQDVAVYAESALLTALGKLASEDGSISQTQGERLALELSAHGGLENDFFVTLNPYSLSRRTDRNAGAFSPRGIVTPEEALRLIGVLLRFRNDFRTGAHHSVDATLFYSALARGLLPTTLRAYRHCLAPERRESREVAAEHLEGIISRLEHLLAASDQLAALSQREARCSAGNALLDQQLYHLQNAVVLVTGALDMLAWFVATLDGADPSPFHVDWGRLCGVKETRPWINQLHDPMAMAIRDAAATTDTDPVLLAATMFRDSYQHRYPLRGGVADFRDALRLPAVLASVVDVRATLGPDTRLDAGTPGLIEREELQLLLPERFHRALIAALVRNIENVLGAVEWGDCQWWLDERSPQPFIEPIDQLAVQFFGPLG